MTRRAFLALASLATAVLRLFRPEPLLEATLTNEVPHSLGLYRDLPAPRVYITPDQRLWVPFPELSDEPVEVSYFPRGSGSTRDIWIDGLKATRDIWIDGLKAEVIYCEMDAVPGRDITDVHWS